MDKAYRLGFRWAGGEEGAKKGGTNGENEQPCDNNIDEIMLTLDGFRLESEMKLAICEINEL